MASYTDNAEALSKFNPYVQQLPVEAMVEVGMKKQAMYNDGVQKIQTSIDNIAGLDIGRTADKKYLQSKINELGNSIKTVAAGDFSDFQLVNSTTGMVNQVSKDPFVVAAVQSTARDRKQLLQMEEDKKKGTLTPHAEYNYTRQRAAYYNNENLADESGKPIVYGGTYTPSWDVDKNIMEAVKMVGDSKWTADNVFKMGGDGKPMKNADGSPIYSDFAIKEMRAGKFNANILAAIDTVLIRPEAQQELGMQGVYKYRGYSQQDFVKGYEKEKKHGMEIAEQQINDLKSKITVSTDDKEKEQLQQGIKTIEDQLAQYSQGQDEKIAYAQSFGSEEAFKVAYHTQQVRNNYSKAATTETYSKEYIKSIPYEVQQEKIKANRDWYIAQETKKLAYLNYDLSKRGQDRADRAQAFNEEKWLYDPKNPKNLLKEEGAPGLEKPVVASDLYVDFDKRGGELTTSFQNSQRDFLIDYFKATNTASGTHYEEGQIEKDVARKMKADPNYLTRNYDVAMKNVKANPKNKYFTNAVTHINGLSRLEEEMEDYNATTTNMLKDPKVVAEGGKEVDAKGISKGITPVTVKYAEGGFMGFGSTLKQETVTGEDLVNLAYIHQYNNVHNSKEERYRAQKMESVLKEKLGPAYGSAYRLAVNPSAAPGGLVEGMTPENAKKLMGASIKVQKETFTNVLKAKENYLKSVGKGNAPMTYTIYEAGAKGPEVKTANDNLKAVLNTMKDAGISTTGFDEFFKDANSSAYSVAIDVNRGTPGSYKEDYSIGVYDGEKLIQSIPVSKESANYIKKINVPAPATRAVNRIQASPRQNTTNATTDNVMSPNAYQSAFVKQNFFASFKRPDIHGADIVKNSGGDYNVYIYADDDKTGDIIGIPIKASANEITPHSFPSIDAANIFIHNSLPKPGFIDYTLSNFK